MTNNFGIREMSVKFFALAIAALLSTPLAAQTLPAPSGTLIVDQNLQVVVTMTYARHNAGGGCSW